MSKKIPPPLPSGNPEKRNNSAQINDSKISYWFIPPEIGALPIPLIQKNILGVVATFTRNGGECWATDTQFGEAFQWSRQKVNAAINGMVAAGWLRKDVTRLSNGTTPRRLWLAQLPVTLSPTVTSSTVEPMDLVTHGDYPCHLRGLPLSPTVTTLVTHGDTNSNIIKKEKVIKNTVADAPTTLTPLPEEPSSKKPSLTWEAIKDQVSDTDYTAIERWITYRTNQHKKKKTPTPRSVQIAIKQQGQHLARAIDYSIGKGYEGIVLPDYIKNQPISRTGMTREQIAQLWEYGWRAFHPNDWDDPGPRPDWMTGWHTDVAKAASLLAFGKDWEDRIQKEPASNSNYLLGPWRRALEEITLPERHNHE